MPTERGNPTRVLLGGDLLFGLDVLAWAGTVAVVLFLRHHAAS